MAEQGKVRVLVVDDEKTIRRFLKATLVSHGYDVFEAADGMQALEYSVSTHPDVIILDLGLPDIDGFEVTRRIRERSEIPIIILSVREDESDKIAALDAGADDYLTKPFDAGEMLARIRAVMRRLLSQNERASFQVKELSVDLQNHSVRLQGESVHLTPTEYDVLKLLVMNAGKVVTHKLLLKEVWNKTEDYADALHLLRVTVSNIRNKIELDPNRPTYVLTEPAIGYRLCLDI